MAHHYLLSTFFQTYMSKAMLQPERSSAWSKLWSDLQVQVPEKTQGEDPSAWKIYGKQDRCEKFRWILLQWQEDRRIYGRPSVQLPEDQTRKAWEGHRRRKCDKVGKTASSSYTGTNSTVIDSSRIRSAMHSKHKVKNQNDRNQ
jgi:hypothetical protein